MRKLLALAIAVLTTGAANQAKVDPSKYTETITVESASIHHQATGATVRKSRPSILNPNGGANVHDTGYSYVDVIFVHGDSRYEVTSAYGSLLQPGVYKMKFNKDYVDILVPDEKGKLQSRKYEIVAVEKISK
jgi:hypothetical protein